jgi:hypothetical protein
LQYFYAQYNGNLQQPSPAAVSLIGSALRLVFHDAAEYSPETFGTSDWYRSDGCINTADPSNGGIAASIALLDVAWTTFKFPNDPARYPAAGQPFCSRMSRADFWVLAAQTMLQEACPYSRSRLGFTPTPGAAPQFIGLDNAPPQQQQGPAPLPLHANVTFAFRTGRVDTPTCAYPSTTPRLPSAMGGPAEILNYLSRNLQLTPAQTIALMGGHTVGRAARPESGFNGVWKGRADTFSTGYYRTLLSQPFTNAASTFNGAPVNQWNAPGRGGGGGGPMMLNSDMQLIYDINPGSASTPQSCPAFASSIGPLGVVKAPNNQCPAIAPDAAPVPNTGGRTNAGFPALTSSFASGSVATQDEPGASWWLANFTSAFKAMTENAYGLSSALNLSPIPSLLSPPINLGSLSCPCMALGVASADTSCAGGACTTQCPTCQVAAMCAGQSDWTLTSGVALTPSPRPASPSRSPPPPPPPPSASSSPRASRSPPPPPPPPSASSSRRPAAASPSPRNTGAGGSPPPRPPPPPPHLRGV